VTSTRAHRQWRIRAVLVAIVVVTALATACGDSGGGDGSGGDGGSIVAQVASFDLVAGREGRFIVGLFSADRTQLVAHGTVGLSFAYLGEGDGATTAPGGRPGPVVAAFLPIPGQEVDRGADGPRLVSGSEATGVYGTPRVGFDRPGFWEVIVTASIEGRDETTTAAFQVLEDSAIPAVGDPAPRTVQWLVDAPGVDPEAIDSRAGADRPVPDPGLHDVTVAEAIAAGVPLMVVVSTPTFCVSRFCGPITDSVEALALDHDDEMTFVHLEVWQNFQADVVNPAAAEWIAPTSDTDGAEPWVFVVDSDGIVTHRFDNVATDAELRAAVAEVLGR
jgi:hypothetical protein